ncbi:MAG TPA: NADPH-dependent FMN reductase, partial [Polyangia bacterium]
MALIATLSGSPSPNSRTLLLAQHVNTRLLAQGFGVELINVRDLPAEDLLHGRASAPLIAEAAQIVERADALVIATPVYKSAYSGVLKTFLDLLPQFALAGKVVFPIATGGTIAHVLSIDYALRPVLHSMGASHVGRAARRRGVAIAGDARAGARSAGARSAGARTTPHGS